MSCFIDNNNVATRLRYQSFTDWNTCKYQVCVFKGNAEERKSIAVCVVHMFFCHELELV